MKSLTQVSGISGILSYGLFKNYQKRFEREDRKCDAYVNYQKWLRICKKFNQRKMESILKGHLFVMPFRLGILGIIQYKRKIRFDSNGKLITKGLIPDWNRTLIHWKELYPEVTKKSGYKNIRNKPIIFRTNEHTDGRIFRFHWKKKHSNVKNITAYELVIPPHYRRALKNLIISNPNIQFCTKF